MSAIVSINDGWSFRDWHRRIFSIPHCKTNFPFSLLISVPASSREQCTSYGTIFVYPDE